MNDILMNEFTKLGTKQQAVVALQVYLELCEVKKYHDIQYFYNENIRRIVITAKKMKNSPVSAFIPVTVYENLNFLGIQSLIKTNICEILFLVIVHADSTCVFYQLSDGLVEPSDTSAKYLRENKQDKLDSDLRKNRNLLEQAALMGLPITLKKDEMKSGDLL